MEKPPFFNEMDVVEEYNDFMILQNIFNVIY